MDFVESVLATLPLPLAVFLSIFINCIISILGVVPSAFLTLLNVTIFGFWGGFWVSLAGEIVGSLIAFWLYRKGFRTYVDRKSKQSPRVQRLLKASNREGFLLVLGLRLLPFVPSGLVTFYASVGSMSFMTFALASSLGKIPALWIEVFAANEVLKWTSTGQIIVMMIAAFLLIYGFIRMKK
ncbi:MAG: VTT domain-containing protein [Paenisporosarcina sp.]